jgi:hypothetical protein
LESHELDASRIPIKDALHGTDTELRCIIMKVFIIISRRLIQIQAGM